MDWFVYDGDLRMTKLTAFVVDKFVESIQKYAA